jgi:signal transduction histidine kinase
MQRLKKGERIEQWDTVRIRKDGSTVHVSLQISPITNHYGEVVGAAKVARNISDRKRAEATLAFLADISATLAALVDPASTLQQAAGAMVPFFADWCVVYLVDTEGRVEQRAHAHRDPEAQKLLDECLEKYPIDWNTPAVSIDALRSNQTQFIAEVPDSLITRIARSPEHLALLQKLNPRSIISVPLQIRGRSVGAITFAATESSRRYMERDARLAEDLARRVATAIDNAHLLNSLKVADRQKDDFLAMLAHELRNPLAAIQYATDAARLPDVDVQDELLDMIDRQVKTLARLIDDLLDISRISRNKIQLRKETVDLSTIARRAAATIRTLVEGKSHDLILQIADDPLPVHVDPTRMEQVFCNLLTNAAKYTPDGGRMTLSTVADNGDALVKIQDTGIGISSEILPHVFDLFTQADKSLDRSQGGLGIGLTVVRKLAEMHGGTVTAYSAGVGLGAEFSVRIPLSDIPPAAVSADESDDRIAVPLRVLVVDDSRDTSQMEAVLLRSQGHQVQVAYDGTTALKIADCFRPHAILLDIGLPGLCGYEVASQLRRSGTRAWLIAVSGYGQAEDRERSRQAGFDHHLVKPVNSQELLSLLRDITPED